MEPGLQPTHEEKPSPETAPYGQVTHVAFVVEPITSEAVPAAHSAQRLVPLLDEKEPATQGAHAIESRENDPAAHCRGGKQ